MFLAAISVMFAADVLSSDRTISELENRSLKQEPVFSVSSLLDNSLTAEYGEYVKDQVVLRDEMINFKSAAEYFLFQKIESNNILYGRNNREFVRHFQLTSSQRNLFDKNIRALRQFRENHPEETVFLIAPTSSILYRDQMNGNPPQIDLNSLMDRVIEEIGEKSCLDIRNDMRMASENLFYCTDHHWTTDGALVAYKAFCRETGKQPVISEEGTRRELDGFFGTSWSASRKPFAEPDSITYYENSSSLKIYEATGENQFTLSKETGLYDEDKFASHDMYGMFLHGNNGFSRIEGSGTGKILVIKDSFANCFIPFLTENYRQIDILDFRNYGYGPDSLIDSENYETILVLYNIESLFSDTALINIIRPPVKKP